MSIANLPSMGIASLNVSPKQIAAFAALAGAVLMLAASTIMFQAAHADSAQIKNNTHVNQHNNCKQTVSDFGIADCSNTYSTYRQPEV